VVVGVELGGEVYWLFLVWWWVRGCGDDYEEELVDCVVLGVLWCFVGSWRSCLGWCASIGMYVVEVVFVVACDIGWGFFYVCLGEGFGTNFVFLCMLLHYDS